MSFPEFESGKKRLLFFVRGRGRGHAVPDLAIVDELLARRDDLDVRLVSYATGADAIKQHGRSLIDLPLPESGSIPEMSVIAGKLIGWLKPDLVASHEEFAAIPAAGFLGSLDRLDGLVHRHGSLFYGRITVRGGDPVPRYRGYVPGASMADRKDALCRHNPP